MLRLADFKYFSFFKIVCEISEKLYQHYPKADSIDVALMRIVDLYVTKIQGLFDIKIKSSLSRKELVNTVVNVGHFMRDNIKRDNDQLYEFCVYIVKANIGYLKKSFESYSTSSNNESIQSALKILLVSDRL